MFLKLDNLTKKLGGKTVLNNLSMDVEEGELVCLLGPSGCGKTTTLRLVGGYLTPDTGAVLLEGEDISTLPPEKRPISTVFQSYALFPHMSVIENVQYGLKLRHVEKTEAARKAHEMLEAVGMDEWADSSVREISGGQQQRVALARSLVIGPKVLLLDEPLSNLDAALRVRMREEVRRIQRTFGVTMLFVTHDQEEAMVVGDRVAIIHAGSVAQIGAPQEVYDHPNNVYCATALGSVNKLGAPGHEIYFRPEAVSIKAAGEGTYAAKVEHAVFLGHGWSYELVLTSGEKISVNADRSMVLHEGENISFVVDSRLI